MASVFFVKGTFLARSQQGRAGQARCGTVSYMIRSKKPVADIMCTLVVRYLLGIWVRYTKGPFNNYVDKIRGRGSKSACFCPRSGYEKFSPRGGRSKMVNFCLGSC